MKKAKYLALLFIFCFIFSFGLCQMLLAQVPEVDVDRATREVDHSLRERAEEKLTPALEEPPEIEEEKAPGEGEGPKFFVKQIDIIGTVSVKPEEFDPIVERYEDKDLTMEDLNILATAIERDYLRRGIIAACFVPPQDIKEGKVILRVVEARMGELQIQEGPFYTEDRIKYYWGIKPGEILRYDVMSKSIQLMNKNPDRDVGATLHAGKEPGTTDVLLDVKTRFPIHFFGSFDREGTVSTGRERTGLGIRHNNFLFIDDTLLVGTTFGRRFQGNYVYHTVPITNFGTGIMYGYSRSTSAPGKELEQFVIKSLSENVSFYINQDIYKKAEYMGDVSIGFDANDKTTVSLAGNGTLSRDRLRIIRIKSTLIHRFPGAITYISPELSQGINGFGSRPRNILSSRSSGNTFTKFNLSIRHKRSLPLNLQLAWNSKLQLASEKLPSQEQFALGGIDSIRGYPSQDYLGDSGFQTSVELMVPAFWIPDFMRLPYDASTLKDATTGILFFDFGYAECRGHNPGETYMRRMAGAGLGFRMRLYNQAVFRFEWGFPVRNLGNKPITEAEKTRFHVSINWEEKLPEEVQRIGELMKEQKLKKTARKLLDDQLKDPNSPLGQKMHGYLAKAQAAQEAGNLQEAKDYYVKINRIGQSLYTQAEQYVTETNEQKKELKRLNEEATEKYREGDVDGARELWQKVKDGAQVKPLVFDLQ